MRAFDIAAWRGDFVTVMRRSKRPIAWVDPLGRSNGIALERLIPNALGALLQANIHHIRPGANTDGAIEHEGKEFGYVLEGILRLVVNDVVYTIRPAIYFLLRRAFHTNTANPGKTSTRVLLVNTPPTF